MLQFSQVSSSRFWFFIVVVFTKHFAAKTWGMAYETIKYCEIDSPVKVKIATSAPGGLRTAIVLLLHRLRPFHWHCAMSSAVFHLNLAWWKYVRTGYCCLRQHARILLYTSQFVLELTQTKLEEDLQSYRFTLRSWCPNWRHCLILSGGLNHFAVEKNLFLFKVFSWERLQRWVKRKTSCEGPTRILKQ